ncbi:MAG TPA: TrmH family RNA methyltransferase, partial [Polyangiaceae bacterium]|nr:TrmH family RNA methyltransferase [Polyangiaceae bacterium]
MNIWLKNRGIEQRFEREYARGRETAQAGPHSFVVVLERLRPIRNAAAIVRTVDALGGQGVYLVGMRFLDPVPTSGSLRNVPLRFFDEPEDAISALVADGYSLFALEPAHEFAEPKYLHEIAL